MQGNPDRLRNPSPSGTGRLGARARRVVRAVGAAIGLSAAATASLSLSGCAMVHQKDREYLSDPIMRFQPDPLGAGLESHNLPRREGSAGGSAGTGGGCGC